jgi:hypothetical protein
MRTEEIAIQREGSPPYISFGQPSALLLPTPHAPPKISGNIDSKFCRPPNLLLSSTTTVSFTQLSSTVNNKAPEGGILANAVESLVTTAGLPCQKSVPAALADTPPFDCSDDLSDGCVNINVQSTSVSDDEWGMGDDEMASEDPHGLDGGDDVYEAEANESSVAVDTEVNVCPLCNKLLGNMLELVSVNIISYLDSWYFNRRSRVMSIDALICCPPHLRIHLSGYCRNSHLRRLSDRFLFIGLLVAEAYHQTPLIKPIPMRSLSSCLPTRRMRHGKRQPYRTLNFVLIKAMVGVGKLHFTSYFKACQLLLMRFVMGRFPE